MNWIKVEGSFVANGTERFITIGNFYNKANTAHTDIKPNCTSICHYSWLLIDDVSVVESNLPAFAGNDTTITEGDSVQLGRTLASELDCKWFVGTTLIDSGAAIWVQPAQTTTYHVKQTICGSVKYDTVTVTVNPVGIAGVPGSPNISIYPNPATTELAIKMGGNYYQHVAIVNNVGQLLLRSELSRETVIDIGGLPPGLYFLRLEGDKGSEVSKFIKR
ncbi:MAG: T9SS type A sorting domain-containing protein [Flavipsychrobacter sp.]|nr:T9SS type A sorting domain-containing protein [Flavipsychrobacter sp.]